MNEDLYGILSITVRSADNALPIEMAHIKVTGADEGNGYIQHSRFTDRDGDAGSIELPAPPESLSQESGSTRAPYSNYDVTVLKDGFYMKTIKNVPIFANINAYLPISLLPLSLDSSGNAEEEKYNNAVIYENEKLR